MLKIQDLSIAYNNEQVVHSAGFSVAPGETVCIVGESGSGKSTILRAIQGLMGADGKILGGQITFDGVSLLSLSAEQMRKYRGAIIATVHQQAGLSMDPITKIGNQFHEALSTKMKITRKDSDQRAIACMKVLSLKEPERILNTYPTMLSGGTNQRVALAMAMVMEPQLILADEPTSALDVTVQVEVVEAIQALKKQCSAAILMVTHNMGVVAHMADHIGVMYKGRILEWGSKHEILSHPTHPYTKLLLASVLRMDGKLPQVSAAAHEQTLDGCVFCSRCSQAVECCYHTSPHTHEVSTGHWVMCGSTVGESVK